MKLICNISVAAALFAVPVFAKNPPVSEDATKTTVVQLESDKPVLAMTIDGAPLTIRGESATWTLVEKNPDTDDLGAYLKQGSRFCLETTSSAACHIVSKGKVARFVVHQSGKAFNIEIRM